MPTSNHGWCQTHMGIWSILVADWSLPCWFYNQTTPENVINDVSSLSSISLYQKHK
jgi:hypothetical protein